jgi:hypothetical protein
MAEMNTSLMKRIIKFQLIVFCLIGFSSSAWCQNNELISPEFEITIQKPVQITKLENGHYLIDFGKAFFGTVELQAQFSQQDTLIIHLGEKLIATNQIDKEPPGTIRYQKIKLLGLKANTRHTIVPNAYTRNTNPPAILLPDSFGVILPFRYCEIENLQGSIEDIEIWQKAYHYKFNDELSSFTSSDTVLNAIWDLCKHTIKATSFAGYYVDGDRERIPYEADAYINQLSHYSVDTVYSLARRTNAYFIKNPTWPTEWILHTALLFYTDYEYTGDLAPLKKYYPMLKAKALMELEREDGLISTLSPNLNDELMGNLGFSDPKKRIKDIVDWPQTERDNYELKDINTVVNAFYFENLVIMSKVAGAIGEKEDSLFYASKAQAVKRTINEKLFNEVKGVYIDGEGSSHSSLHANMFPLAFGLVPENHIQGVVDFVKSRGMACSVYGAQFLLEGLLKNGEAQYALNLIGETQSDRSWWNMIKCGSTMALEAWDIKYKPNLDWNHAWGTAPLNAITRYLWGITPLEPGFSTAQIKPQLGNLQFTEITVPTKNGGIVASYKVFNERHKQYEITIPDNMRAVFILPNSGATIKLNNKRLKKNQPTLLLENGLNRIDLIEKK